MPLHMISFYSLLDARLQLMISGGSYDFYTGKIGFEIDDGPRVFTGLMGNKDLQIRWISNGFATVIQDFEPNRFIRDEDG